MPPAYDPADVHEHRFRRHPELQSHRARYIWAERDGRRQRGTAEDLWSVETWRVKIARTPAYQIGAFPYRRSGFYVSPSFGHERRAYEVRSPSFSESSFVHVEGIPAVRMVRRDDWGWELHNPVWVATSIRHRAPSVQTVWGEE